MKSLFIEKNKEFIGRSYELKKLADIDKAKKASIVVMYGRRRIGKTELLEQAFRDRNIVKFEGIEGLDEKQQLERVMSQLSLYVNEPLPSQDQIKNWGDFFQLLATYTATGKWTIYFEELQWLANYKTDMISDLKYAWDNFFKKNPELLLLLCGSAPSFMIDKVVHSKALYNRSQYEISLKEFTILEAKEFLKGKSNKEVFDAYLTVGGIPEYLKWVNKDSSLFLGLCNNSFAADSFFSNEYKRIFTSHLAENKYYKEIIEQLSKRNFLSRSEIAKSVGIESGGTLSSLLNDLESCGFVEKYHPFNRDSGTYLSRYTIQDNYLYYYFKFIKPIERSIKEGVYNHNPKGAIKTDSYYKWLGLSFERWCRKYHYVIAKILGFSGVHYQSGSFFNKAINQQQKGFQVDLVFERADHVLTICEVKYLQSKVTSSVIEEFERKLSLFPNEKNKTIHKVLICPEGADQALLNKGYFDHVITFDDLIDARNWD